MLKCFKTCVVLVIFALIIFILVPGCGGGGGGGGGGPVPPTPTLESSLTVPTVGAPSLTGGDPGDVPPALDPDTAIDIDIAPPAFKDTQGTGLTVGNNTISFPFDSLTATTGFTYELQYYDGVTYQTVNPQTNPELIDCTRGYWAFNGAAIPAPYTATGPTFDSAHSVILNAGWNFIAYPRRTAQLFSAITVTNPLNGQTMLINDAATTSSTQGNAWLYAKIYIYHSSNWYRLQTNRADNGFEPWVGYYIYSWIPGLTINFDQPIVDAVTPAFGPEGTTVTVTGNNFGAAQGTGKIEFNSVNATTITSWVNTQIICNIPAGASTGPIVVTAAGGQSNADVIFGVAPKIDTLNPTTGFAGSAVTVLGANFGSSRGTSVVKFNGVDAASYTSWSDTRIVCTVPQSSTGAVTVTTQYGTSNTDKIFTVLPSISTISPTSGPIGTNVTISGWNFGALRGTSKVEFNGTEASAYVSWMNTRIICTVDTGTTTGAVAVTTGDGTSNIDKIFTIADPPVLPPSVDAVSPNAGNIGLLVTITGLNFGSPQGTGIVTFNGTNAGAANSWTDTQIKIQVPAGASTGPVVVNARGLNSNNDVNFTVVP
ncbi:MAG: IPT/TIG domain-containing protein [Chloroflexi bacterium]|nr:IPT/TIG domain-containing protein [Chloroflexota bacterium]